MMEMILYLYQKSQALVAMGMPMSVLKEDKIFDRVISIKYDVPNDNRKCLTNTKKISTGSMTTCWKETDKEGKRQWQLNILA